MKNGEKIECPHCGQTSFARKKTIMDGWTKTGETLVCAICSKKIAEIEAEPPTGQLPGASVHKLDALASLLETEREEKPVIKISSDEKKFCKDCAHFIEHPFLTRCGLHEKNVNPMHDCPDFINKPHTETKGKQN